MALAWRNKDTAKALAAVRMISDQDELVRVAKWTKNIDACYAAVGRMEERDFRKLRGWKPEEDRIEEKVKKIKRHKSPYLRMAIMERVDDQELYFAVAKNQKENITVRVAAVKKMTNPVELRELAWYKSEKKGEEDGVTEIHSWKIRETAVENDELKDQELLADIARNDPNDYVKIAATKRMNNQDALEKKEEDLEEKPKKEKQPPSDKTVELAGKQKGLSKENLPGTQKKLRGNINNVLAGMRKDLNKDILIGIRDEKFPVERKEPNEDGKEPTWAEKRENKKSEKSRKDDRYIRYDRRVRNAASKRLKEFEKEEEKIDKIVDYVVDMIIKERKEVDKDAAKAFANNFLNSAYCEPLDDYDEEKAKKAVVAIILSKLKKFNTDPYGVAPKEGLYQEKSVICPKEGISGDCVNDCSLPCATCPNSRGGGPCATCPSRSGGVCPCGKR